jgi:hypothetical protein
VAVSLKASVRTFGLRLLSMKKLAIVLVLGLLGWQGYYQSHRFAEANGPDTSRTELLPSFSSQRTSGASSAFKCDGRTYCSQMTSCEEANFFLKNCPGVKMDGNNDGIPCEKQWCR